MVIRWLGVFGSGSTLGDALLWEFTQTNKVLVSAEKLRKGVSSLCSNKNSSGHMRPNAVGLLVANSAIKRRYDRDVYSSYSYTSGRLNKAVKVTSKLLHTEYFVYPKYLAVVIKGKVSTRCIETCAFYALEYGIELLRLTKDGCLIPYPFKYPY